MRTTLTVPRPFALGPTLRSHGWLHTAPFYPDQDAGILTRIERIRDDVVALKVREAGGDENSVKLVVESDAPPAARTAVRDTVTRVLGLDEDLRGFFALARRDRRLRPVLRLGAGRTARGTSLWEDAVKGIAQTNVQWKQALTMIARLSTLAPKHRATGLHAFPTPDEITAAGEDWLRRQARLGYRAPYIATLARDVQSGARDLADLERRAPALSTRQLVAELTDIDGIGPATAHTLAGFLRKHDVMSVDSATLAYVAAHYPHAFRGEYPTPAEARAVFQRYGEWIGKAWWYEAWVANHVAGDGTRARKG